MSRLGRLSGWLGRSRRRAQRNTEERIKRLRRWFHRPLLEQLEDRLMPGSIVVGISELLHGGANDPFAEVPEVVTPPGLPERVEPAGHDNQDPWPIYVAPQAPPLPSTAGQDIFATPDKQDDAITSSTATVDTSDWRGSVFDGDLFRALDDVFGGPAGGAPQEFSGPFDTGGGQASDPGGGGAALPGDGGTSGGGGNTSPMMVNGIASDYGGASSSDG